jgi:hypothetical protein
MLNRNYITLTASTAQTLFFSGVYKKRSQREKLLEAEKLLLFLSRLLKLELLHHLVLLQQN